MLLKISNPDLYSFRTCMYEKKKILSVIDSTRIKTPIEGFYILKKKTCFSVARMPMRAQTMDSGTLCIRSVHRLKCILH